MPDPSDTLKAKLNAPPGAPVEEARKFLQSYWGDEGMPDAIRAALARTIAVTPRSVIRGLEAIEALLLDPPPEGTLSDMVLWCANHPLQDQSDESAKQWLREVAELVREVLGNLQPPRRPTP